MSDGLEEYTDEQTGMRLTVEREYPYDPDWPRITAYAPDNCTLTAEEGHDAIHRLLRMAGYDEALKKWVTREA